MNPARARDADRGKDPYGYVQWVCATMRNAGSHPTDREAPASWARAYLRALPRPSEGRNFCSIQQYVWVVLLQL